MIYRRRVSILLALPGLLLVLLLVLLLAFLLILLALLLPLLLILLLLSGQSTRENEEQRDNECESGHGDSCWFRFRLLS